MKEVWAHQVCAAESLTVYIVSQGQSHLSGLSRVLRFCAVTQIRFVLVGVVATGITILEEMMS